MIKVINQILSSILILVLISSCSTPKKKPKATMEKINLVDRIAVETKEKIINQNKTYTYQGYKK